MTVEKTKLYKAIEDMESSFEHVSGVKPVIFKANVKDLFVKAVCENGVKYKEVIESMKLDGIDISKRQVFYYFRKLFGKYKKLGRPAKWVDNDNNRIVEKGFYKS